MTDTGPKVRKLGEVNGVPLLANLPVADKLSDHLTDMLAIAGWRPSPQRVDEFVLELRMRGFSITPLDPDANQRLLDADAVLDALLHADDAHTHRPSWRSPNWEQVRAQVQQEAVVLSDKIAEDDGLDVDEFYLAAFLTGVAAVHHEGADWALWLLTQRRWPPVNIGIARAAARRIVAGRSATEAHRWASHAHDLKDEGK